MVCITVAFNLDQQRWTRAFDVEWGSTIWQLKEQMLSPEGTREDAEAFELQRLGRRVPDTEKVYQEHTLDFEYLGPEEGARRARQETQDLEQWERQKAEEEAARRSRPKPAPEAPAAGPAKPKEALPFDTAPVVKAAPPLPAGEHEITITIDRSMDLKTSVTVQGGSNVLAVKERLSATDPTGQMNVASFGLGIATGSEEPATAISDEVVLTEKHLQLEITEPYVETAESRANAPMPYTPATRPKVEPTPPPPPRWEVVGGGDKGGILVREGESVGSPQTSERLSTGALIEEMELKGERLHFKRLTGTGPEEGWISIKLPGKDLAVRTDKTPPKPRAPPPTAVGPNGEEPLPIALFFPGQGSQYVKMMENVKDMPKVKEMLEKAGPILGYDILDICLNGPESKLEETKYCQPAMFIGGLAGIEKLKEEKPEAVTRASVMAGLSLGEYTALCAAGVMTFEDGLKLVKLRGEAMQEAALIGKQAMLSVAGLEKDKLQPLCVAAAQKEGGDAVCQIANCLFPGGFSVGGTEKAINFLKDSAEKAGALQAKVLKTAGAFHTPLMKPAQDKLAAALEETLPNMKPPQHTVWMNATAEPVRPGCDPADIVANLKTQLTNAVLWDTSVKEILKEGVNEFYEVGPMKQIKAMMKRIDVPAWKATKNIEV